MLKLTVEAGEYLQIGEDVKVIFTGCNGKLARVLIDAPKSINIARSKAMEKHGTVKSVEIKKSRKYETETELSDEAKRKIKAIIMEDRRNAKAKNLQ